MRLITKGSVMIYRIKTKDVTGMEPYSDKEFTIDIDGASCIIIQGKFNKWQKVIPWHNVTEVIIDE